MVSVDTTKTSLDRILFVTLRNTRDTVMQKAMAHVSDGGNELCLWVRDFTRRSHRMIRIAEPKYTFAKHLTHTTLKVS